MNQEWRKCETVWDLYSTLMKEATTHLFHQNNKSFTDLTEIYRWVISDKVSTQRIIGSDLMCINYKPSFLGVETDDIFSGL